MDKPKHWVKNVMKKMYPSGWGCPYLTQSWVKTTQHFLECKMIKTVDVKRKRIKRRAL